MVREKNVKYKIVRSFRFVFLSVPTNLRAEVNLTLSAAIISNDTLKTWFYKYQCYFIQGGPYKIVIFWELMGNMLIETQLVSQLTRWIFEIKTIFTKVLRIFVNNSTFISTVHGPKYTNKGVTRTHLIEQFTNITRTSGSNYKIPHTFTNILLLQIYICIKKLCNIFAG